MEEKKTSLAKIEANRRNAQKSTGAKDTTLTRFNALKHGLLSKEVFLWLNEYEEMGTFKKLGLKLMLQLAPQGELENILVDRVISSIWRVRRALKVERKSMEHSYEKRRPHINEYLSNVAEKGINEIIIDMQNERQAYRKMIINGYIEKILRYETAIERQIYKALHELIRLRSARKGEGAPVPVAVTSEIKQLKKFL
jgi:hypothetical protein